MAASFAHEINNPLQAIQGCLDLAYANIGEPTKQERYLGLAIGELARLKSSVHHMLDFSRISKGDPSPVQLRGLVEDVLALQTERLDEVQVQVEWDWDETIPTVMGVGNQLKQVFLNLILNAIESMPQGGKLTVRGHIHINDRSWAVISFSDTGVGISSRDLNNIFDPFFTTKAEGTGLGLAVSHNIITGHGGHFTVESDPGSGSIFAVWLPLDR
jgi:signal transduction histidine kinase